ncbi:MAG TPA: hypothetical protein VGO63_00935 [Candidatus Paceibacterota bacterium]|jgi:hypothetical protein|nr:hypothetical protein [Candidatus Paceibacterota bacterium]
MKIINIVFRVIFCLILATPILGVLGILPAPTPDLYNTPEAFAFINMLFITKYILYIEALVFLAAIVLTAMNRMAIAAILILPITVNIVAFHLFLDGGLFTGGAVPADALLLLNIYFLWQNRGQYKNLWVKSSLL